MRERIAKLKNVLLNAKPSLSAERIVLATEAYQKYAGEPIYLHRAHVFEYVLDHKQIVIRDGELLAGSMTELVRAAAVFPEYSSGRMWLKEQLPTMSKRKSDPLYLTEEDTQKILNCLDWWDGKSTEDLMDAYVPQYLKDCERAGVFKSGGKGLCSSAINANFKRMFELGFRGHIDLCKQKIEELITEGINVDKQRRVEYWQATIIALEAAIRYSHRHADYAEDMALHTSDPVRKHELKKLAEICRRVPEYSPRTFYEAVQFQWFMHVLHHIEANAMATSLGRFDQNLYSYYANDIKNGILTPDDAVELIESLFLKVTSLIYMNDNYYSQADAGYPMWQILMIGGVDEHGEDASNELSYLVLDATEELKIAQPAVALRVSPKMPESLLRKGVEMNQKGMANPAFFNDEVAQQTVINKGADIEQARDWLIIGCVEPHPGCGVSDGSPVGGNINAPKCLEIALHNGVDPVSGLKLGPETGDPRNFKSIEEVIKAVQTQLDYFWDLHMKVYRMTSSLQATHLPMIYQSVCVDGCIESGESIQEGGCVMPYTNIFIAGPSTVADSIMAIDYAVFKDNVLTMDELIHLCDTNFEGNERMRQYLLNKTPKFGNDIPEVDEMITEFLAKSFAKVNGENDGRHNGKFSAGNQSQTHNVTLRRYCGATPSGRMAYTALSDNASPTMGRDTSGPTAAANSVAHLHPENFHGGCLYNTRFDPHGVTGERGVQIIEGLVKNFCDEGGYHVQINVVDDATLRDAQKNPENYRDLVVRVAGYLAYFTELDREVQDVLISRTAHLAS